MLRLRIDADDNRFDEIGGLFAAVQEVAGECCDGMGSEMFLERQQQRFEFELEVRDIAFETSREDQRVIEGEHGTGTDGDECGSTPKAEIAGDGDAVLAGHGEDGAAVESGGVLLLLTGC